MRLAVLGCYGGSAPGRRPTSLLIDDRLAIDAGALASALPVDAQARVDQVFLTHAHLDHLATLPFLLDNVFLRRRRPVEVLGAPATLDVLRQHVFNDLLWPDFAALSNGRTTLLAYRAISPGESLTSGDLDLSPFAMAHTVHCQGYLVQGPSSAVIICSDTDAAAGLPGAVARARGLSAVLIEASFPEREAGLARESGHLTPRGLLRVAEAVPAGVPVFAWHLKPEHETELRVELGALGRPRLEVLEQDHVYDF